jgi:hypothetical protein
LRAEQRTPGITPTIVSEIGAMMMSGVRPSSR